MDMIVGLGLLAALITVVFLFAALFGPAIAAGAKRAAKGEATGSDGVAALAAIGVIGSDSSSCDGGSGGGCD